MTVEGVDIASSLRSEAVTLTLPPDLLSRLEQAACLGTDLCLVCGGSGTSPVRACWYCGGSGALSEAQRYDLQCSARKRVTEIWAETAVKLIMDYLKRAAC